MRPAGQALFTLLTLLLSVLGGQRLAATPSTPCEEGGEQDCYLVADEGLGQEPTEMEGGGA